jgi:hypothetical protein
MLEPTLPPAGAGGKKLLYRPPEPRLLLVILISELNEALVQPNALVLQSQFCAVMPHFTESANICQRKFCY